MVAISPSKRRSPTGFSTRSFESLIDGDRCWRGHFERRGFSTRSFESLIDGTVVVSVHVAVRAVSVLGLSSR